MCENYKHDILKGFCSGIFGGLGVFIIKLCWDEFIFKRDVRRIVYFLRNNSSDLTFRTTHRISASTNLTEDRVRFVASTSKLINRNQKEVETWSLNDES